jgi:hypothetical protein
MSDTSSSEWRGGKGEGEGEFAMSATQKTQIDQISGGGRRD